MPSHLNMVFDKIFVIALKEDEIRIKKIKENLAGIDYEFFWGINTRYIFPHATAVSQLPKDFFQNNDTQYDKVSHWSLGGLGCGLSHRNVIKYIMDNNIKTALILEDDVTLVKGFEKQFVTAMKYLPMDWELLYLGFIYPSRISKFIFRPISKIYSKIRKIKLLEMRPNIPGKVFFPKSINRYFDKAGVYVGGHAYALTNIGACKLLSENTPMTHYSDPLLMYMVYNNKIKAYSMRNSLINQDKSLGSYTE